MKNIKIEEYVFQIFVRIFNTRKNAREFKYC